MRPLSPFACSPPGLSFDSSDSFDSFDSFIRPLPSLSPSLSLSLDSGSLGKSRGPRTVEEVGVNEGGHRLRVVVEARHVVDVHAGEGCGKGREGKGREEEGSEGEGRALEVPHRRPRGTRAARREKRAGPSLGARGAAASCQQKGEEGRDGGRVQAGARGAGLQARLRERRWRAERAQRGGEEEREKGRLPTAWIPRSAEAPPLRKGKRPTPSLPLHRPLARVTSISPLPLSGPPGRVCLGRGGAGERPRLSLAHALASPDWRQRAVTSASERGTHSRSRAGAALHAQCPWAASWCNDKIKASDYSLLGLKSLKRLKLL